MFSIPEDIFGEIGKISIFLKIIQDIRATLNFSGPMETFRPCRNV